MKLTEQRSSMLHGVLLITLFACAAFYIGDMNWVKALSLSPMVVGIVLGMLYANSLRNNLPETWVPGIAFCGKRVLRFGIILYGFRLTFQDVAAVGLSAIVIDAVIVSGTILLGIVLGKLLRMDRSIALLTACGSAICGAAAVLGVDGAIRPKPYKTAVAVATVVIFGTLSMFLYPVLYRAGVFDLPADQMGIFAGSTIHRGGARRRRRECHGGCGEQFGDYRQDDPCDDAGACAACHCIFRGKGCGRAYGYGR